MTNKVILDSGQTPWGKSGNLADAMTAEELISKTGLDWEVELFPVYTQVHANPVKINSKFAVVRTTDNMPMGVVGGKFDPVQNREIFSFADHLVGEGASYVAGGPLKGGKHIFAVVQLPKNVRVAGTDMHIPFLYLRTGHDGTKSTSAYVTMIRAACTNVMTAVAASKHKISIPHTKSGRDKMLQAKEVLGLATEYTKAFCAMADELMELKVSDTHAQFVLDRAIPSHIKNRDNMAADILALEAGSNINGFTGTGWGLYNAVTEYLDHGRHGSTSVEASMNNLGASHIEGVRNRTIAALRTV